MTDHGPHGAHTTHAEAAPPMHAGGHARDAHDKHAGYSVSMFRNTRPATSCSCAAIRATCRVS